MISIRHGILHRIFLVGLFGFAAATPPVFAQGRPSIANLQAQIATLQANPVLALAGRVALDTTVPSQPVVRFTGVNVQIVNGSGSTATVNGVGNLIVGYDEQRTSGTEVCSFGEFATQLDCTNGGATWALNHKSGSHNVVIGQWHNYSRDSGLITGFNNTINGREASVTGGGANVASAQNASVSGGAGNRATEVYASVTGGRFNVASAFYASVSGGRENEASNLYASVSGGHLNDAFGEYSSVSGGQENDASGDSASVSGGVQNIAAGLLASVSGGKFNSATGIAASVTAGSSNLATGEMSSVTGGASNSAAGLASSVSGGGSVSLTAGIAWQAGTLHSP